MFIIDAFKKLYPDKYEGRYDFDVKYSAKFKGYNANVKYTSKKMTFYLSRNWERIDEEIKIGLIQHLLNKVFKTKVMTTNIELYDLFLKNIHIAIPKENVNEELKASFDRVNEKYFAGMVTMPNLVWGQDSVNKLGSYDYGTDTISMSKILLEDEDVLDYVMYHEMLHKKIKFYTKNNKSYSHTGKFRKKEKEFEGYKQMEEKLSKLVTRKSWKKKRKWAWEDYF